MTIYETVLSVISDIQGSGGGLLVTALGSRGFLVQDMEGSGSRGNARKPSDQYIKVPLRKVPNVQLTTLPSPACNKEAPAVVMSKSFKSHKVMQCLYI